MRLAAGRREDLPRVLFAQGGYYLGTGVLPFISRGLFETATGPKREWWLVQTVSGLVLVIGGALVAAALRRNTSTEIVAVASGTAATLAAIDVVYVAKRRIAPTYLIDAGAEIGILAALAESCARR
ncbi:MAG: hypothetical protein ACJ76V_12090 [Thermoleophilaceae bacterium]